MSVLRLLLDEIWHRKVSALVAVLVVLLTVGCVCGTLFFLEGFDRRTESLVAQTQEETQQRVEQQQQAAQEAARSLEDDYRKITKGLGFNLLILPAEQNLEDWLREDFARETMPEDYVEKLGEVSLLTVNHLLPTLTGRMSWPEQKREIVVVGVRGQVPIAGRSERKPIMEPVPQGKVVLGQVLGKNLGLEKGSQLTFHGRSYEVHEVYPPRGTRDDITMWLSLAHVQELLGKPGEINAIFALQCHCETADHLARIEREIKGVLGERVQIVEIAGKALARTQARIRAGEEARRQVRVAEEEGRAEVASVMATRQQLREQRERLAALLLPAVLLGAVLWLGSMALINVRQRRGEIGILRALGVPGGRILALFLGKAVLLGVVGGALGCLVGLVLASQQSLVLGDIWPALLAIVLATPLVAVLASWLPALWAVRLDPALTLREE